MAAYKWRTQIPGAVYVHSDFGDDYEGDGSMESPFQNYRRSLALNPSVIVCAGVFSEDMADGNHARTIRGDYYGAAVFDGDDKYLMYGYTHINMIIRNTAVGTLQTVVNSGSVLFAGAGRALNAGAVGHVGSAHGVAGSPVLLEQASLYWGIIGGSSAVTKNIYSKPRSNEAHPISIGFQTGSTNTLNYLTLYDCPIERRRKLVTLGRTGVLRYSIIAKFAIIVDDAGVDFTSCLFTSDCKFYYNNNEIVLSGATSEERRLSLISAMDVLEVPSVNRSKYTNCIFSLQTADQIFNNCEHSDFTIRPGSDADLDISVGALPVSLNVPIIDNSDGVINSWDENTTTGCLEVLGNAIRIDDYSEDLQGSILSKIISINPLTMSITGLYAPFYSLFRSGYARLNRELASVASYVASDILPVGKYVVEGALQYGGVSYVDNNIVTVSGSDTSFIDVMAGSRLHEIGDFNYDVIYVRATSRLGQLLTSADTLQEGGIYYNFNGESIGYRGRTVVSGESFMAEANDQFTASPGYQIAAIFDDERGVPYQWIPMQLFGDYFEWRNKGSVRVDDKNIPISSGNDLSYVTSASGGYSDMLVKHPLTKHYFQLGLFINRFRA